MQPPVVVKELGKSETETNFAYIAIGRGGNSSDKDIGQQYNELKFNFGGGTIFTLTPTYLGLNLWSFIILNTGHMFELTFNTSLRI